MKALILPSSLQGNFIFTVMLVLKANIINFMTLTL